MTRLICDGRYSQISSRAGVLFSCRYNMRALASFKKVLKKIYRTHTSLVHMSVKFKSSCNIATASNNVLYWQYLHTIIYIRIDVI